MEEIFPKEDHWWENYNSGQLQEDICPIGFLRMINFLGIVIYKMLLFLWTYTQIPFLEASYLCSASFQDFRARLKEAMSSTPTPFQIQLQGVLPQVHEDLLGIQRSIHTTNAKLQEVPAQIPQAVRCDLQQSFREMEIRLLAFTCSPLWLCGQRKASSGSGHLAGLHQ